MAKSTSKPKVQNIDKVKNSGIETIFKKSAGLYRKMLHNGKAKNCRFTIVFEYDGRCDVFLSDKSAKSAALDLKVSDTKPSSNAPANGSSPYGTRMFSQQRTTPPKIKRRPTGR
jgi:dihydrofolate reductase